MKNNKSIKFLEQKTTQSFIIFRTDRIGDTVLSIPCAEAIKQKYKNAKITFAVRSYTAPLFENNPFVDEILCVDKLNRNELITFLKEKKYDCAISLFSNFNVLWSMWRAKIPIRVAPLSKWFSLFANIKVRQKRSECKKNEAEYNLELLKSLEINNIIYPKIYLSSLDEDWFRSSKFFDMMNNKKFIIIHPGSGHSSKNWPIKHYLELAKICKDNNINFLITGSKSEIDFYRREINIANKYKDILTNILDEELDLRKFLVVLAHANLLITNSTGPMHCASALGVSTIAFFSPVRVCTPIRWGVFVEDKYKNKNIVHLPNVPECEKCIEGKCKYFNCMQSIDPKNILQEIIKILGE